MSLECSSHDLLCQLHSLAGFQGAPFTLHFIPTAASTEQGEAFCAKGHQSSDLELSNFILKLHI